MSTVWNQQVRYFQRETDTEELDIHALFITDLFKVFGEIRDSGFHVVLGIDTNDDVRDGSVSAALANIGIVEAVVNNHKGESVPVTCAKNMQIKLIHSIWTSTGLDVLWCGFLLFHDVYGFDSDQQLIWVGICNQTLYGHHLQMIYRAPSAKFKIVKVY